MPLPNMQVTMDASTALINYIQVPNWGGVPIEHLHGQADVSCTACCPCAAAYGDRARQITRIAEARKLGKRLVRGHPMIEAEVVYAVQHEACETPEDFIARRTRLAFLDTAATEDALPRVRCCCSPWLYARLVPQTGHEKDGRNSTNVAIHQSMMPPLLACMLSNSMHLGQIASDHAGNEISASRGALILTQHGHFLCCQISDLLRSLYITC